MTSKGKTCNLDINNLDNKKSRLEFSIDKTIEYMKNEYRGVVSIPLDDSLSIDEMVCIEESYFEIHNELSCESGCENCDRYCSSQCMKILIHGNSGDDWSEEVNSVDDCLEEKRSWKNIYRC